MPEEPFDQHFQKHFHAIWSFARRRTSSSADADDIAAETFAVAWRRRGDVPESDLRPWLFGVARNVLLNHHRTVERQSSLQIRIGQDSTEDVVPDPADCVDRPLWSALSALLPEDRELLMMRAWDELAVGDIAKVLGCTANAASSRLHKARARLAQELRRQENDSAGHEVKRTTQPARERT